MINVVASITVYINSMHAGLFFNNFVSKLTFSKDYFRHRVTSPHVSECQIVRSKSGMMFCQSNLPVQTVCKGFQQMTKVTASKDTNCHP